ncbi:hypothetical protein C8R43DRAFT_1133593 [Mycena crocata]|nr:hypothetical protein C8R43DRAFT_1133593 [Mycena crocata]
MQLRPLLALRRGFDRPAKLAPETLSEIMQIAVEDQPCLLSSVIMRQDLANVCPWWTFVLYGSVHQWRTVVVTRFFDPSFVKAWIGMTSGSALDVFIDTRHFNNIPIGRLSTVNVRCTPFPEFMLRTVPLLASALHRARRIHVQTATTEDLHNLSAVLCTFPAPNLVRTTFSAREDLEPHTTEPTVDVTVWAAVTSVIVRGGSPAVAAFPNTTHLFLGGCDGLLEVSWPMLRDVLRSADSLIQLCLGRIVYSRISEGGEVILPHLTHLKVDMWDEDWVDFMAYINPPILRVFQVVMSGMWSGGEALWVSCHPNLLGNIRELELRISSPDVDNFDTLLPLLGQLRDLDVLRCCEGVGERLVQALQTPALASRWLREVRLNAQVTTAQAKGILHQRQDGRLAEDCRLISRGPDVDSYATWVEHTLFGGAVRTQTIGRPPYKTYLHWSDGWEENNCIAAP